MDQKSMVKQFIEYEKSAFDSFMNSMATIQDQVEKSLNLFLDNNPLVPDQSKNMIMEWEDIAKSNRDDFKQILDDSLDRMESYLVDTAEATQRATKSTSKALEKTSESHSGIVKHIMHAITWMPHHIFS